MTPFYKSPLMAEKNRQQLLYDELRTALSRVDARDLKSWGWNSATRLPRILARRAKNLVGFASHIVYLSGDELSRAFSAWRRGELKEYIRAAQSAAAQSSTDLSHRALKTTGTLGRALIENPKETAPGLLALVLGFYAGSGGLDGDGGISDTDIMVFGIGEHRSIFTHSIIAGALAEASILGVADLAGIVIQELPAKHDPFWDKLNAQREAISNMLSCGASAGIAYHLAVDAVIQPAPYKDFPVSMPLEAHQLVLALNAAAEGADALGRVGSIGDKLMQCTKAAADHMGYEVRRGHAYVKGFIRGLRQK